MRRSRAPLPVRTVEKLLSAQRGAVQRIWEDARAATNEAKGRRRVLFNPLYVSNVCFNDCTYCGFRASNPFARRTLSVAETCSEATALMSRGVQAVLLLAGEYSHRSYTPMLLERVAAIASLKPTWLGVEVAPLLERDYVSLADAGCQCVVLFQETYDKRAYSGFHRERDAKSDFRFRRNALGRAAAAGIPEVGLGVLLGLADWRQDVLSMYRHAIELLSQHPRLRLRFSLPRFQPAAGVDPTVAAFPVRLDSLRLAAATLRLALPDASLVLTGRESSSDLLHLAAVVDVLGKDGSTSVGGYSSDRQDEQFQLQRDASLSAFVAELKSHGYAVTAAESMEQAQCL